MCVGVGERPCFSQWGFSAKADAFCRDDAERLFHCGRRAVVNGPFWIQGFLSFDWCRTVPFSPPTPHSNAEGQELMSPGSEWGGGSGGGGRGMCSGYKRSNKQVGEMVGVGTNDHAGNKSSKMRPVVCFQHCWRDCGCFRINICRRG